MNNKLNQIFFVLFLSIILLALNACSGEDKGDNTPPPVPKTQQPGEDLGKDNIKDLVVTGGIKSTDIDWDANVKATIIGYVNLTDSIKLLYGSLIEFGVQLSTNESFNTNDLMKISGQLVDNRTFYIDFKPLSPNTQYYYRSYIQTGTNLPIFGKTVSFKTDEVKEMVKKKSWSVETPAFDKYGGMKGNDSVCVNLKYIYENNGVVCATDPSLLTAENLYNFLLNNKSILEDTRIAEHMSNAGIMVGIDGFWATNGVSYNYKGFRIVGNYEKGFYPVIGDSKEFRYGYPIEKIASMLQISIAGNDEQRKWNLSINPNTNSELYDKYSEIEVYYGIWNDNRNSDGTGGYEELESYKIGKTNLTNYSKSFPYKELSANYFYPVGSCIDQLEYYINNEWDGKKWKYSTSEQNYNNLINRLANYNLKNFLEIRAWVKDDNGLSIVYTIKKESRPYVIPQKYIVSGSGSGSGGGSTSNTKYTKNISGATITLTNSSLTASTIVETIDFDSYGWSNSTIPPTVTTNKGTSVVCGQGEGSFTPMFFTAVHGVRFYAKNTLTLASTTKPIAKIVLNCDSYKGTDYVGNEQLYASQDGNTTTIVNEWTGTSGGTQARVKTIEITYAK